jgi:hypothetical protein
MCLSWLARVLFILGYPEQAVARNGEVAGYVRELTHPNTAAVALTWGCMFRQLIRERHNAHEQAEAVMALATEQGFPLYLAAGTVVHGWALAANGQRRSASRRSAGIGRSQGGVRKLVVLLWACSPTPWGGRAKPRPAWRLRSMP